MKTIDLHVHSTYSDGSLTPEELVALALSAGLSAFALTDHDTTDGIDEAVRAARGSGLEIVPGIEFPPDGSTGTSMCLVILLTTMPAPFRRSSADI